MKTSLKTFLDDLYEIDPSLKAHEAEIIPLVETLLASDPAMEPDTEFVKRLRMQLKERAAELSDPASSGLQKWFFALGGAVTAAVILPLAFIAVDQQKPALNSAAQFSYNISDGGTEAFGSLSGLAGETTMSRNQSGGGGPVTGGGVATAPAMPMAEDTANRDMAVGSDAKMIAPYPMVRYEYVYDGAFPELTPTVDVYQRRTSGKALPMSSISASFNLGSIDLSSFSGMNMDSVSFSQNVPYGYQLNVNFRDAAVTLDAQWDQWPQSKCQTDACFQAERVKLTDIPADDQLLTLAQAFIAAHGIDVSHYGTPEVDTQWKRDYDRAPDKAQAWIPDQIRVIYPLMIDGHKVSDHSGASSGISVGIHTKSRNVMNVYGIMSRDYVKSAYAGVSDPQEIKDYLSKLDNYASMPEADRAGAKTATVTVTLGEPVLGYSVFYSYKDNTNQELLVPVLTFKVKDVQGGDSYFYRSSVVVPLAADMLKDQMNGGVPIPVDNVRAM